MASPSFVQRKVLNGSSTQSVDFVRGTVDDLTDVVGIARVDEFIPMPSEAAHIIGLPTVEEAIPSPKEFIERFFQGGRPMLPPLPGRGM